jgi:GntR family transcriptional regulator
VRSGLAAHLPLYAQVENVIIDRVSDGSLPAGSRLPSEDGLVQEYAVSRTTIRAAIQSLVQRGLVEIRRGKGTFVTEPKISQELTELTGFVEDMQALGRHPTAKVLDQQIVPGQPVGGSSSGITARRGKAVPANELSPDAAPREKAQEPEMRR